MSKPIVVQFLIPLPISVEEYEIGKLYGVAEASKNETGGGEGIEILVNEPYEGADKYHGRGQYTHKVIHLATKVPAFIRILAPKGSLEIHEKSWNAHPFCKTEYSNPAMKEQFYATIESIHKPGRPDDEENQNVQQFTGESITIDIVNDKVSDTDYKEDVDPSKFHSTKTGRGPLLAEDWRTKQGEYPVMTCFKLYEIKFNWWGLQDKVQAVIKKSVHRLLRNFHRQLLCWIDRWHGLTVKDIRKIEEETKEELDKMICQGEVKGMVEK
jgi:hypothetical protein